MTTGGCHTGRVPNSAETLRRVKEVRAEALKHARIAQQLAKERRQLLEQLVADGYSQSDIARELGVSRQAIQKMLSV